MRYNLGVDVGGTFTDVIIFDKDTQELTIDKVLTTPENPSKGVLEGIQDATSKAGASITDLDLVFHGTTVVTNMILEETGADVGLLVSSGYEDILQLARAWTPGPLYGWINFEKPDPLADLEKTAGIDARLDADGTAVSEVNRDDVLNAASTLVEQDIEALAVMTINSYVDGSQEEEIRNIVQEEYPDLPVSISTETVSEYGEYERTLTAVINAYGQPTVINYLNDLDNSLRDQGMQGTLNIVRSDGGTMSTSAAKQYPVNLALSGPSGGVVGAANLAETLGIDDVLTLDMGGTSTDVSLVEDGEATVERETEVGYRSFKSRTVDITTVGTGGGSIADLQLSGSLEVGLESCGADPGPACYGRGGKEPTVTDANVVLGRIPESVKLGGTLELDRQAAWDAIEPIAEERDISIEEAAQGILDVVNQDIYSALRVVSVEKGYDPREFGLVAFGGAGPMHANAVGELIEAYPVIIPPGPGVMSAFGFLTSDIQNEFTETYIETEEEVDGTDLAAELLELRDDASEWLASEDVPNDEQVFDYSVDCRYYRQDIQMSIDIDPETLASGEGMKQMCDEFEQRHEQQFGFTLDSPVEFATLRVVGRGTIDGVQITEADMDGPDASHAITSTDEAYFDGAVHETPVYDRESLRPGNEVAGPAIVVENDATTTVLPSNTATVNRYGCLEITRGEE